LSFSHIYHEGNSYNIINVNINRLSEDERKILLLHTELDIHCTTDVEDQKYTRRPNRYVEIYFELKKRNDRLLSKNLQAWRHFMLTGIALQGSPSYIKEAAEMLKISNLTKEERRLHDIYEKNRQKQLHREWYVVERLSLRLQRGC